VRQIFTQNLGFALLDPIGILFAGTNLVTRFLKPSPSYWQNAFHYGANIAAPLSISTAHGIKLFMTKTAINNQTGAILLSFAIATSTIITVGPFQVP
jgi:uncharacterized membrane protein